MIKYLGSKRLMLPALLERVRQFDAHETFLDVFSGTSRVGHAMKAAGLRVTANDHNAYAHVLAQCYVQADRDVLEARARRVIDELQRTPPHAGFFTETYSLASRFFHPRNAERIEGIRERIEELDLESDLRAVILVSLMEAADRVDSTTGVQMAYLKQWAPRAHNELELRLPKILPGQGRALGLDALDCVREIEADVVYLDPPYNQHSYLRNYHVWETLVLWDAPSVYGIACKRDDCRTRISPYNSRRQAKAALERLLRSVRARHLLVSFSNEGHIGYDDMVAMLEPLGRLDISAIDYRRYVGARIGIYNPRGEKVGRIGHLNNVEYLFAVDLDPQAPLDPPVEVTLA